MIRIVTRRDQSITVRCCGVVMSVFEGVLLFFDDFLFIEEIQAVFLSLGRYKVYKKQKNYTHKKVKFSSSSWSGSTSAEPLPYLGADRTVLM